MLGLGTATMAAAQTASCLPAGRLASVEGSVQVRRAQTEAWLDARAGHSLCAGDTITVRSPGRAAIRLDNDVLVRLDERSTLTLREVAPDQNTELGLSEGIAHVLSRFRKKLGVVAPFINALVDGTEFTVVADADGRSRVVVAEGRVRATNAQGETLLAASEAAESETGAATPPRSVAVRPLDAVAWAIHYPQVVWLDAARLGALPPDIGDAVREAQTLGARGRHDQALATLLAVPEASRPPAVQAMLAGTQLALGRVAEARRLLEPPEVADSPEGLAVRSVLATAGLQSDGLALAEAAAQRAPESTAAALARSYALQGARRLPEARAAAVAATTLDEANPVAWARRAELELTLGEAAAGGQSALTALSLDRNVHRAAAMHGYAALIEGDWALARSVLDEAVLADGADPLAHYARGLALLRWGQREAGRGELEMAVLLDPSNAAWRNLLAQTYQEQGRAGLAADQLDLARRLDPASPLPWAVEATQDLAEARPSRALKNSEEARQRNDARSTLRPSVLGASDLAARSLQSARAYEDLGQREFALRDATRSLQEWPSDRPSLDSLARALTETEYAEPARLAAWTQAGLRQSPGQWPLPSQYLMPTLPGLDGAQVLSLHEATPLLERRPLHLGATVLGGNASTRGASALGSWSNDQQQIDLSAMHYRRDGETSDGDVRLRSARLHGQWTVAPQFTLHAEFGESRRESGDPYEPLFANNASNGGRVDIEQSRTLVGARYWDPATGGEWLAAASRSVIHLRSSQPLSAPLPPGSRFDVSNEGRPNDVALQGHGRFEDWTWTTGFDVHHANLSDANLLSIGIPGVPPIASGPTPIRYRADRTYLNLDSPDLGPWTLRGGVRRVRASENPENSGGNAQRLGSRLSETQGALGTELRLNSQTRWHLSWFETAARPAWQTASLEPVMFNGELRELRLPTLGARGYALASTLDATDAWDTRWIARVRRDRYSYNDTTCGADDCGRWHRDQFLLAAHRALGKGLSAGLSLGRSGDIRDEAPQSDLANLSQLRTDRRSIQLGAEPGSGWLLNTEVMNIHQSARTGSASNPESTRSEFWIWNASARWNVSREWTLMLLGRNLLDKSFRYADSISDQPADWMNLAPGRRVTLQLRWAMSP